MIEDSVSFLLRRDKIYRQPFVEVVRMEKRDVCEIRILMTLFSTLAAI